MKSITLDGEKMDKQELKEDKIARSDDDLLESLRRHIRLLRDYHVKAFEENNADYLGEVAGKLRLLIYERGRNKPLLKDMMKKFNSDVRLGMIGPAFPNGANIDDYFNHVCGAFSSTDGKERIKVTPMGVVATWAQQMGSSHEDHSLDKEFAELISHGLFINGRQIAVDELRRASKFVLLAAEYFFQDLEKLKKLLSKEVNAMGEDKKCPECGEKLEKQVAGVVVGNLASEYSNISQAPSKDSWYCKIHGNRKMNEG